MSKPFFQSLQHRNFLFFPSVSYFSPNPTPQLTDLLSNSLKNVTSASMAQYLRAIKATNIPFSQQDVIQFANIIPKSEVELHVAFGGRLQHPAAILNLCNFNFMLLMIMMISLFINYHVLLVL